jgi:hypothetical protein
MRLKFTESQEDSRHAITLEDRLRDDKGPRKTVRDRYFQARPVGCPSLEVASCGRMNCASFLTQLSASVLNLRTRTESSE